jgi:hypothetical protein
MFKALPMLMLVTAQLLAGLGGSRYLCISHDGSYCCIDSGPEHCTCCKHDHEDAEVCEPDHDCCHKSETCEHHAKEQGVGHSDDECVMVSDPCGCTHIQISAEQVPACIRTTNVTQHEQFWHLLVWMPNLLGGSDREAESDQPPIRYGPAAIPDVNLAVLATVVIRC